VATSILFLFALVLAGCGSAGQPATDMPAPYGTSEVVPSAFGEGGLSLNPIATAKMDKGDTNAASLSQQSGGSAEQIRSSSIATLCLVRAGEERTHFVRVDNVRDLYAVDMKIKFDPTQLQAADADDQMSGVQIRPGEAPRPDFVAVNNVDNTKGIVHYIATQLGDDAPFSGGGTIATILWQERSAPDAEVSIEQVILVDKKAGAIEVAVRDHCKP